MIVAASASSEAATIVSGLEAGATRAVGGAGRPYATGGVRPTASGKREVARVTTWRVATSMEGHS